MVFNKDGFRRVQSRLVFVCFLLLVWMPLSKANENSECHQTLSVSKPHVYQEALEYLAKKEKKVETLAAVEGAVVVAQNGKLKLIRPVGDSYEEFPLEGTKFNSRSKKLGDYYLIFSSGKKDGTGNRYFLSVISDPRTGEKTHTSFGASRSFREVVLPDDRGFAYYTPREIIVLSRGEHVLERNFHFSYYLSSTASQGRFSIGSLNLLPYENTGLPLLELRGSYSDGKTERKLIHFSRRAEEGLDLDLVVGMAQATKQADRWLPLDSEGRYFVRVVPRGKSQGGIEMISREGHATTVSLDGMSTLVDMDPGSVEVEAVTKMVTLVSGKSKNQTFLVALPGIDSGDSVPDRVAQKDDEGNDYGPSTKKPSVLFTPKGRVVHKEESGKTVVIEAYLGGEPHPSLARVYLSERSEHPVEIQSGGKVIQSVSHSHPKFPGLKGVLFMEAEDPNGKQTLHLVHRAQGTTVEIEGDFAVTKIPDKDIFVILSHREEGSKDWTEMAIVNAPSVHVKNIFENVQSANEKTSIQNNDEEPDDKEPSQIGQRPLPLGLPILKESTKVTYDSKMNLIDLQGTHSDSNKTVQQWSMIDWTGTDRFAYINCQPVSFQGSDHLNWGSASHRFFLCGDLGSGRVLVHMDARLRSITEMRYDGDTISHIEMASRLVLRGYGAIEKFGETIPVEFQWKMGFTDFSFFWEDPHRFQIQGTSWTLVQEKKTVSILKEDGESLYSLEMRDYEEDRSRRIGHSTSGGVRSSDEEEGSGSMLVNVGKVDRAWVDDGLVLVRTKEEGSRQSKTYFFEPPSKDGPNASLFSIPNYFHRKEMNPRKVIYVGSASSKDPVSVVLHSKSPRKVTKYRLGSVELDVDRDDFIEVDGDRIVFRLKNGSERVVEEDQFLGLPGNDVLETLRRIENSFGHVLNPDVFEKGARPMYGRTGELEKLERTMSNKKHTVLLGDSGSGLSRLIENHVDHYLSGVQGRKKEGLGRIYFKLVTADATAGTMFRGSKGSKWSRLIDDIRSLNQMGYSFVLVVEDLHTILQPHNHDEEGSLFQNLPAVAEHCTVLATSDRSRFEAWSQLSPQFANGFDRVLVEPMSADQTLEITRTYVDEAFPEARVPSDVLGYAISILERFSRSTLPGAAIQTLDQMLGPSNDDQEVDRTRVDETVASVTSIPEKLIEREKSKETIDELLIALGEEIQGQEELHLAIARDVRAFIRGANSDEVPILRYLIPGPTGNGKTGTIRALSRFLFGSTKPFKKFDGANFQRGVSNLQELIEDQLRKYPFSFLVFDEFEKMHPDAQNLVLAIGDGSMTDSYGEVLSSSLALIFATSNAGAEEARAYLEGSVGFDRSKRNSTESTTREELEKIYLSALEKAFTPEVLNRFHSSRVIVTNPIEREQAEDIVTKYFRRKVVPRFRDLGYDLVFEDSVVEWAAEQFFSPVYGARRLVGGLEINIVNDFLVEGMDSGELSQDRTNRIVWDDEASELRVKHD